MGCPMTSGFEEIRGRAINESQVRTQNGEVIQSPVKVSADKVGEEVVIRGDQVTRRIDS